MMPALLTRISTLHGFHRLTGQIGMRFVSARSAEGSERDRPVLQCGCEFRCLWRLISITCTGTGKPDSYACPNPRLTPVTKQPPLKFK